MTNEEIIRIATAQSAKDIGCEADDFFKEENVVVVFKLGQDAKKYYMLPIGCNFISYGNNVVAAATKQCLKVVNDYVNKFEFYHCFETPNMRWLNERLEPLGMTVCFMAEYYLPDVKMLKELPCQYEMRVLEQADLEKLYLPQWSNAICSDRKERDVLGVGAYDGDKLVGLAGCSADAQEMWQIGVDVLPEYRRKGIASAITAKLALEIMKRDKVPFYCTAWSNIRSARNAVKSGFLPAWAEMTIKPIEKVNEMNG
ncbi:GNAT family N-acetyltransferase [uncultured Ruminobacter sp.]|uniref:GNAT family N-acetyltransferase n=1 Tax=uncultured Ruminobacter sp. TaxID=538947 RepID=UPI0026004705|nr:GNAT family N-acetyltransferase [uncultured Ruminobacter sp.]